MLLNTTDKLVLNSVDYNYWQLEKQVHLKDEYFSVLSSITNIDECQCCFCGAKDGKYLELHHKDGNHDNYDIDNLDTICCFCHRTVHLGWACIDNCATLYFIPNEKGMLRLGDIDFSFYNLISRLDLYARSFQKKIDDSSKTSLLNNPKFLELWQNIEWLKGRGINEPIDYYFNLYDILSRLQNNPQKQQEFRDNQLSGKNGLFFLRFNTMVLKPLSPILGWTYEERWNALRSSNDLSPENFERQIDMIIGNLKQQGKSFVDGQVRPIFAKAKEVIEVAKTSEVVDDNEPSN